MRTYLKVLFDSEGAPPSAVRASLSSLGFMPVKGAHDFEYEWPDAATVEEVLAFGDRIHAELSGLGCLFQMETV